MKKTYVVYVHQGSGHEYHGMIQFAEWYGPYTEEVANNLERELNNLFHHYEGEKPTAESMPLQNLAPKKVQKIHADELFTYLATDE